MTMKVFNLACDAGHGFEGWFASGDAFDQQSKRRLIACPLCGSSAVRKMPSAPRLNFGAAAPHGEDRATAGGAPEQPASGGMPMPGSAADRARRNEGVGRGSDAADGGDAPGMPAGPIDPARVQQLVLAMARKLIESSEDVGDRFVEEARKIHYREAPGRAIRGAATRKEAAELRDEGIEVFSLPVPLSLKGPLQ